MTRPPVTSYSLKSKELLCRKTRACSVTKYHDGQKGSEASNNTLWETWLWPLLTVAFSHFGVLPLIRFVTVDVGGTHKIQAEESWSGTQMPFIPDQVLFNVFT